MNQELSESDAREVLLWLLRLRRRAGVAGASMFPVLREGDEVLYDPRAYRHAPPRAGDVVVARHPQRKHVQIIKRVTAVQRDGRLFLQGDNPDASTDSRDFGTVSPAQVLGKVTSIFG